MRLFYRFLARRYNLKVGARLYSWQDMQFMTKKRIIVWLEKVFRLRKFNCNDINSSSVPMSEDEFRSSLIGLEKIISKTKK